MKNIFVGNLSFQTQEADLRNAFATYGTVDRVSITTDRETGRSRGFAFVEMSDDRQGDAAIAGMSGMELDGRALTVNVAKPREDRGGGGGRSSREQRW